MVKRLFLMIMLAVPLMLTSCGNDCSFEEIVTDSLPNAKLNVTYSAKIEQESTCSYTAKFCEVTKGTLPKGITLDGNGDLGGKAENLGVYIFTVRYEVCFGSSAYGATDCREKTKEFTIIVE